MNLKNVVGRLEEKDGLRQTKRGIPRQRPLAGYRQLVQGTSS